MLSAIPVLDTNIATPTASTPRSCKRHPRRASPTGPAPVMEEHCDDTAALLRGLLG